MLFSNFFAGAFGLNIGDLSLKIIQLKRARGFSGRSTFNIQEARSVALPPGLIVNGEVAQPELVRKKLLQLIGAEGDLFSPLRAKWAVVDLPEPKSFLKLITIDAPPETLTETDVVYQARKHLPFEMEEVYLDWKIINPILKARQSQVLIGAAPKIIADSYTYLLESANINVLALEIEAVAVSRALITRDRNYEGEARALLNLGATRSSLIIYDHDTIQFSTTIPFSGELLTTAIMQDLKLPYAEAEKLKVKNGLAYDKKHPSYIKTVSEITDLLIGEIKKSLLFYKEHFVNTNPITHITMCGGSATLINLDTIIASKLKISARPANVWKNITKAPFSDAEKEKGLVSTSAIGLALRAAENPLAQII